MKKIFFLTITAIGLLSCDNSLELYNKDGSDSQIVFSTPAGAKATTEGIYSAAQNADALCGGLDATGEFQSDNVTFYGSFPTLIDIRDYTTVANNSSVSGYWAAHYGVIGVANFVIKFTPTVPSTIANPFPIDERNDLIGQAKFMRALMHFRLSQYFGHQLQQKAGKNNLSIPYVTQPYEGTLIPFPRLTLEEVHNSIERDLLDAINVNVITNTSRTKATVDAAKALLARLYLYQEKWDKAANYADEVISSGSSTFSTGFAFYNNNNAEMIFSLQNITGDVVSGTGLSYDQFFNGVNAGGRGDCPFSDDLWNLFDASDLRRGTALVRTGTAASNAGTKNFTRKYPNGTTRTSDPSVLRISEMYLIRGEANFRGGTSIGDTPLNDINKTRIRATLAPLTTLTINDILDERRKEFCFEGLRRMDLLRYNLPLRNASLPQTVFSQPGADKTIFPIPASQVDVTNGLLIQNPSY